MMAATRGGKGGVKLIYVGAGLVIGGAASMVVSYHLPGPTGVADFGKVVALVGFVLYVVGRVRYRAVQKAACSKETSPGQGTF